MEPSEREGSPAESPPGGPPPPPGPVLRVAGDYSWRLLVVGAVVYFGVRLLSRLALAVIPFVAAILVSALLAPLAARLRRRGMGRGASTVTTMLVAVVVLGGLLTLVVVRAAQQAPQLGDEINNLLPQVKHWLVHGPLKMNQQTVDNLNTTITDEINKNSSKIASTAVSTGRAVLSALGGIVLAVFCTIFLVYDGDRVWGFLLKGVPAQARRQVEAAGQAAWQTVSYYIRGTLVVASFHGVVVAVTLTILGVPLAFPLAVLVALGSFVPLVGAVVTGAVAVGVAGLGQGLVAAIVMLAVLLADNQVEAHVLQPFVVGRYVRIHPLATVLALAAGGLLFGIFGAVIAVPLVATINASVRAAMSAGDSPGPEAPPAPGDPEPRGPLDSSAARASNGPGAFAGSVGVQGKEGTVATWSSSEEDDPPGS